MTDPIAKQSEIHDPPALRRQTMPAARYLLDDQTADALSAGGTLDLADGWTVWDWCRWGAPFFLAGLGLGAIVVCVVQAVLP